METGSALPIDTPQQPNPPRRPRPYDDAVVKATAYGILQDVIEWLGDEWKEEDRAATLAEIENAIAHSSRDGFERAQYLDDRGWQCDARLVEILDSNDGHHELREAVKAWVAANGITPKFEVGQRVTVPEHYQDTAGTIVRVEHETAEYVVATDKQQRDEPDQTRLGGGYLIPFEVIEAA